MGRKVHTSLFEEAVQYGSEENGLKKQEIVEFVEGLLVPLAEKYQYEIVDVEYEKEAQNWYLRVFADKAGGFGIDDCVTLSRALEAAIEADDPFDDTTPYILEISSPGLDRPLKKDKDFVREMGKLVDVKLYKADKEKGLAKEFQATLTSFDPETGLVGLELDDGTETVLNKKDLAGIRLAVIF